MNAPQTQWHKGALGLRERDELLLGRTHWTVADYHAAGLREFHERPRVKAQGEAYPGEGKHYARCFVEMFCPHEKMRAQLSERIEG